MEFTERVTGRGAVLPGRPRRLAVLACAAMALLSTPRVARAEFAALVGGDYYSGAQQEVTKSVIGVASLGLERGFATVAGARFDDNLVGAGFSATAGAGASLGSPSRIVRVIATRYVGDETYRAWRLKAGPFYQWGGASLGLSFVRYTDDQGGEATGGLAEIEKPVSTRWKSTFEGSAAEIQAGMWSTSGSAGIAWAASPHLTLSAALGVARNGSIGSAGPAATTRGPLTRPSLGNLFGGGAGSGPQTQESSTQPDLSATVLFGLRVPIP